MVAWDRETHITLPVLQEKEHPQTPRGGDRSLHRDKEPSHGLGSPWKSPELTISEIIYTAQQGESEK